jgi:hypothetical protein
LPIIGTPVTRGSRIEKIEIASKWIIDLRTPDKVAARKLFLSAFQI